MRGFLINFLLKPQAKQTVRSHTPVANLSLFASLRASNENDHEFRHSEELAQERYDTRASEDIEKKRARLLYQSRKRGMLENGVILASFADRYLNSFDAKQLDEYDRLINLPTNDWDIFYWATKTKPTPKEYETATMQMLRNHLKSKVSNSDQDNLEPKSTVLGKSRPDDIVMPASKSVQIDIDPREQNLSDYKENLFDYRIRKFKGGSYIQLQTNWRREQLKRRLKRSLSQPISLRNLSDNKTPEVFSQRQTKSLGVNLTLPSQAEKIDSDVEKLLKHHNFMQHLFSKRFTDQVDEYDMEVDAWRSILWHRNYGTHDQRVLPTEIKCSKCDINLHCCDHGHDGYVPKEILNLFISEPQMNQAICQRCSFLETYNVHLSSEVSPKCYNRMLIDLNAKESSVVLILIDLTDFPNGIWPDVLSKIGRHHDVIIVGNKLDLLPYDGENMIERILTSFKRNYNRLSLKYRNLDIENTTVLSARTGFGVEGLVSRILAFCETPRDVYLLGSANSGKSTLFNALLQSDLSADRSNDLISRVSPYHLRSVGGHFLKFPVANHEGWQIDLKKRHTIRFDRNTKRLEISLENTTKHRQATMPHISMLINRIGYLPKENQSGSLTTTNLLTKVDNDLKEVRFTKDHPLAEIELPQPMAGSEENFREHKFLHYTPSCYTSDQIHDLLTEEEKFEVLSRETLVPRKYSLRPLQTIFIAGLARLDLLSSTSQVIFSIFASKFLPIHVVPTRKADHFYNTFIGSSYLGVPFGDKQRLKDWPGLSARQDKDIYLRGKEHFADRSDIVLSSVGWALVRLIQDHECLIRVYTPEARGIYVRTPALLRYGDIVKGRKVRDTPLFEHKMYENQRMSLN